MSIANDLKIQQQPQRQDSLAEQLHDLCIVATRLGMYDAVDWLREAVALARGAHTAYGATVARSPR